MISSNVVLTSEHLDVVVRHFMRQPALSFDVESVGIHRGIPALNTVTWLSMATFGMTVAIPCGHPIGSRVIGTAKEPRQDKNGKIRQFTVPIYEDPPPQLTPEQVFDSLRPLFFREDILKIAHEATFDLGSTAKYWGEICPGPYGDTKVLMRLLDENKAKTDNGLKAWVKRFYRVDYDKENVGKKVEVHPFNKVAHYSYMDALYTWLLWQQNIGRVRKEKLEVVHDEVERPLIGPLTSMRLAGVNMDVPRLKSARDELSARLVTEEADVYRAAGRKFNLNSSPQKQEILFGAAEAGGQGLKPWKMTDHGASSTDSSVLESYPGNPLCRSLLAYADTHKLLSTYINAWLGVAGDPKKPGLIVDGILYPEFQQHGTVTGRFSGRTPNPQNIPRPDKPDGKLIRGTFIAPPGHRLVIADYGQIELVILAHLIGRGKLFDGFMTGVDPHTTNAAAILKRKPVVDAPGGITKDERQRFGKTLNFTVVNGGGPKIIAEVGGFSEKQARQIAKDYDKEFPEVDEFRQAMIRMAKSRPGTPYIRGILGRKRRLPGLHSSDNGLRMYNERQLFNFLIQNGAAELMKLALIRADYMLADQVPDAFLTMTVHDELVAVAPDESAEECRSIIVEAMTGPEMQKLIKVPLKVDAHVVERWNEAK